MYTDSKLQTLQKDYANLVADQQKLMSDITSLQSNKDTEISQLRLKLQDSMDRELESLRLKLQDGMERELQKVTDRFDSRLKDLNRELETRKRKIPDVQRDIDTRTRELANEAAKKAV